MERSEISSKQERAISLGTTLATEEVMIQSDTHKMREAVETLISRNMKSFSLESWWAQNRRNVVKA